VEICSVAGAEVGFLWRAILTVTASSGLHVLSRKEKAKQSLPAAATLAAVYDD
jgi:hypothetical protein